MNGWILWGIRVVQLLQSLGNPVLDRVFAAITLIGDEKFALLMVPFLYWALDKALALRLGFLYLGSAYVNTALKAAFAVPRPSPPAVRVIAPAEGYAFPSGHAQTTATVWGYLATQVRSTGFRVLAAVIIALVALSRVYLGAHYPQDVIVGIAIAILLIGIYNWFVTTYASRIRLSLPAKLLVAIAIPTALLALHAETDTGSSMGTLLGLGVGVILENEWIRFSSGGPWGKRVTRFLLGLVVLLAIYFGLKAILPEALPFRVLRYALVGSWASLGAPWMFVMLRLADRH